MRFTERIWARATNNWWPIRRPDLDAVVGKTEDAEYYRSDTAIPTSELLAMIDERIDDIRAEQHLYSIGTFDSVISELKQLRKAIEERNK